jgi:hypothetical protein
MIGRIFCLALAWCATSAASAGQIDWAGRRWQVREGAGHPCTSDLWSADGVRVDADGGLHLKLARQPSGRFACVEIESAKPVGFGRYSFDVSGPIGAIDKNVVLGLFLYPPADVGPDGTNEIDIEIARWNHADAPQVNYTAWYRSRHANRHAEVRVPATLDFAHFDLDWSRDRVQWESSIRPGVPVSFEGDVADRPQTLILNLWLFAGAQPSDGREVEFVIHSTRLP